MVSATSSRPVNDVIKQRGHDAAGKNLIVEKWK
jgi:hypothetical protein